MLIQKWVIAGKNGNKDRMIIKGIERMFILYIKSNVTPEMSDDDKKLKCFCLF